MAFSVENPGFEFDVSDQVEIHQSDTGVLQSSGTSSAALSGDSSCRSCIRCYGRRSSFTLDRRTYCSCRGSDYDWDNKCDECMSGTKEEMEA